MPETVITLKKYQPDDFPDYYGMVREYAVMRYITEKGLTPAEARQKFEEMLSINATHAAIGYFKVYDATTGQFIGDCKLEPYGQDSSCLETGYILKENFWGKGYATRMCEEMLALAEQVSPHMDIIGIIDPANVASKRVLEKFGFKSYFIGVEDGLPTEKLRLVKAPNKS